MSASCFQSGETRGTLRYFNPERGFGIIDASVGTILIHANTAGKFVDDLREGAGVRVAYCTAKKGLRAEKLFSVDEPEEPEWHAGVVKFFNAEKGYGFITSPGLGDVFLHVTVSGKVDIDLQAGTPLEYQYVSNGEKRRAIAIRPAASVDASPVEKPKKPRSGFKKGPKAAVQTNGAAAAVQAT